MQIVQNALFQSPALDPDQDSSFRSPRVFRGSRFHMGNLWSSPGLSPGDASRSPLPSLFSGTGQAPEYSIQ
eukprot:1196257-Prorocentrum_minimum.AAC.2